MVQNAKTFGVTKYGRRVGLWTDDPFLQGLLKRESAKSCKINTEICGEDIKYSNIPRHDENKVRVKIQKACCLETPRNESAGLYIKEACCVHVDGHTLELLFANVLL